MGGCYIFVEQMLNEKQDRSMRKKVNKVTRRCENEQSGDKKPETGTGSGDQTETAQIGTTSVCTKWL